MLTQLHSQLILSAIGSAARMHQHDTEIEHGRTKLRQFELQLEHDREMFGMKTELIRSLIHALIEKRVDAVEKGFSGILSMYADDSRHYRAQQDKYADQEIKASDPLERANLRTRLSETDLHLTNIRNDTAQIYREMNRVILLIGGSMPPLPTLN